MKFLEYLAIADGTTEWFVAVVTVGILSTFFSAGLYSIFRHHLLLTFSCFAFLLHAIFVIANPSQTLGMNVYNSPYILRFLNFVVVITIYMYYRLSLEVFYPHKRKWMPLRLFQVIAFTAIGARAASVLYPIPVVQNFASIGVAMLTLANIPLVLSSPVNYRGMRFFQLGTIALSLGIIWHPLIRLGLVSAPAKYLPLIILTSLALFTMNWIIGLADYVRIQMDRTDRLAWLGTMTAEFAHEIANPLQAVQMSCQAANDVLEKQTGGSDDLRPFIRMAGDNAERAIQHIAKIRESILGVSHETPRENVLASEIVRIAAELAGPRLYRRSVQLKIENVRDGLAVLCSKMEAAQALANLLINGADAGTDKSDWWIRLKVKENHSRVDFEVQDKGDGIPAEIQDKIMDPFFTTKGKGAGSGLGLSFSRKVANRMGGDLFYNSDSKHTEFILRLPKGQWTGSAISV